jgi:ABC-type phosphate transport system substrate-binding protein
MKKSYKFLFMFVMPMLAGITATANAAGVIIAAKGSGATELSPEEAKKIFLGREPRLNGESVVLIFQRQGPIRDEFESKVLQRTGADLTAYWAKLIFTGKANAPIEVGGDADVKAKINSTPGAIGYVSDGAADGSVKVLYKY